MQHVAPEPGMIGPASYACTSGVLTSLPLHLEDSITRCNQFML